MVQNPLNQSGFETQQNSVVPIRKRISSNSQPIPPLKPVLPKSEPIPHPTDSTVVPPQSDLEVTFIPGATRSITSPTQRPSSTRSRQRSKRRVKPPQFSAESTLKKIAQVSQPVLHGSHAAATQVGRKLSWMKPNETLKRWLIVWFTVLGSFTGITALAFAWLASAPPSVDCKEVTTTSVGVHRLYCAQELSRSGKLEDLVVALSLLENWSPTEPLYKDAQEEITEWSNLILVIARSRMAKGEFKQAVDAATRIPAFSPVYLDAQEEIAIWRQEWQKGETIFAKAREAIKAQNWKQASQQVVELSYLSHEFWRLQQADVLIQQILREKQARINLVQAQKLAKGNDPNKLAEAIVLVQKVPDQTDATAEAKAALKEWSQTLITYALEQWQQGNSETAFSIALKLPLDPALPAIGKDLIQLSKANQLAKSTPATSTPETTPVLFWNLMEALSAVKQIPADSPFYADAQMAMEEWQAKLNDLTQLGFASMMASFGDRSTLELAVAQANQISEDRPYVDRAQALAAEWRQLIQGLEDRPYIARAERWAAANKIPDLRAAIAQISQIPQNRAAWNQAQKLIAQWTDQIETIEDQPIWDQAQKLAKQSKLSEAITEASKIEADRALYSKAQAAIAAWQAKIDEIEIAQDQPILDKAYGMADLGRLTMAIDTASQIAPGRALYNEAQVAIKIWAEEREVIWRGASESPTSSPTGSDPDTSTSPTPSDSTTDGSNDSANDSLAPDDNNTADADPDATVDSSFEDSLTNSEPSDNSDPSQNVNSSVEGYYDERFYDNGQ